jgi:hypothetical protein
VPIGIYPDKFRLFLQINFRNISKADNPVSIILYDNLFKLINIFETGVSQGKIQTPVI